MSRLPPAQTPLNQHSLIALELWLKELGAKPSHNDRSVWNLVMPKWSAQIKMQRDNLLIAWEQEGKRRHCGFPYGLSRLDVQSAILQGP
tara:strand:- start:12160 stop:12426 length:267 start_codon:yes stop_codon:yes gene_type:complete